MLSEAMRLTASFATTTLIASALICGVVGCSEKKPAGPPEAPSTQTTPPGGETSLDGADSTEKQQLINSCDLREIAAETFRRTA